MPNSDVAVTSNDIKHFPKLEVTTTKAGLDEFKYAIECKWVNEKKNN